jgi:peptidoglycan hydrolase-like protein with peptidoglycan-binding domain
MPNPGQPTISQGATGDVVRRLQRAIRRNPAGPELDLVVDGIFGPMTESLVVKFQKNDSLSPDGIVGPITWHALPGGGPMPVLSEGSTGQIVRQLQDVVSFFSATPLVVDGDFGPHTKAAVRAFQKYGQVAMDGIVGEQTWDVSLHASHATLETRVGLNFVIG